MKPLTTAIAFAICRALSTTDKPYPAIAADVGATTAQVKNLARGATWQHISCDFVFLPRAISVRRGVCPALSE